MAAVLESPKVQSSYVYIGLDTIAKQDGGVFGMVKVTKGVSLGFGTCDILGKEDGGVFGMSNRVIFFPEFNPVPSFCRSI